MAAEALNRSFFPLLLKVLLVTLSAFKSFVPGSQDVTGKAQTARPYLVDGRLRRQAEFATDVMFTSPHP